ncbi:HTH-type transcriptional activator IlvY [Parahaliea aestuarii]|uniref:HTH-type transcriptional activator IlvY n=1 Tax=Parahaliea aestuarii TaxID=1852021 RepID=A0A5C8ZNW2_9GAMM|nr:HTH-type transcriptional activator IlvY [Parahaliea aestuarii]TXS89925.1 HTH-type transcriptional activator IlvY [Parahaliea aestuarii]
MDIRSLQVFLSVADTLNFSRSAGQLHLSVSAVSRSIQRLEELLGHRLLARDKRTVQLTPAGRDFRDYARRAVADWDRTRRQLGAGEELVGEVSLYCSVTATYSILAPILEAFRSRHPGVDIQLHTGDPADAVDNVLSGQHDLAVTGRPTSLPRRVSYLQLLESPMLVCMPAADCAVRRLAVSGDSAAPEFDWSRLPFIFPERGTTRDMLEQWFEEQGIQPNMYAQVAGHEAVVAMVGLGLGVGIAPELVVRTSGLAGRVSAMPVWRPLPALGIGLCAPRASLEDPRVKAFWDVAASTFAPAV